MSGAALAALLLAASAARAAEPALPPESAQAVARVWLETFRRLRPELADLAGTIKVRVASPEEMRRFGSRPDVEGHYEWNEGTAYFNGALLARLRERAANAPDPDAAIAFLTYDAFDHEVAGHADAVRRLQNSSGRYSGMVLEEELTSFVTETEGLTRAYADPAFREGLKGVETLARERHAEVLALPPRGLDGYRALLAARRYNLPTTAAKVAEYGEYADKIRRMLGQSEADAARNPAIVRARENAAGLKAFYDAEATRLQAVLAGLKPVALP